MEFQYECDKPKRPRPAHENLTQASDMIAKLIPQQIAARCASAIRQNTVLSIRVLGSALQKGKFCSKYHYIIYLNLIVDRQILERRNMPINENKPLPQQSDLRCFNPKSQDYSDLP